MKIYRGVTGKDTTDQTVVLDVMRRVGGIGGGSTMSTQTHHLGLRLDLANHSPTGLSWGYGGSGPAQCSLAILADALGDDAQALSIYQDFKFALIAGLPQDEDWAISDTVVRTIAGSLLRRKGKRHAPHED